MIVIRLFDKIDVSVQCGIMCGVQCLAPRKFPLNSYLAILFVLVLSCSLVSDSLRPQRTVAPARLLCLLGFSKQGYWSGLPCCPPGGLPNPGIKPVSPALQGDSLPSEPPGKPYLGCLNNCLDHSCTSHSVSSTSVHLIYSSILNMLC